MSGLLEFIGKAFQLMDCNPRISLLKKLGICIGLGIAAFGFIVLSLTAESYRSPVGVISGIIFAVASLFFLIGAFVDFIKGIQSSPKQERGKEKQRKISMEKVCNGCGKNMDKHHINCPHCDAMNKDHRLYRAMKASEK